MGCNAWNHPSNCNCGWGGDTGGFGVHLPSLSSSLADWWRSDRKPRSESYTIPNASCPVCGEAVFFYQSPYGGRVFFDELGPPWPKHPCTDNSEYRSGGHIVRMAMAGASKRPLKIWSPLLFFDTPEADAAGQILLHLNDKLPGKYLFLPPGYQNLGPIFFKKDTSDPTKVILSVWDTAADRASVIAVSAWFQSAEERRQHLIFNKPISAEALNRLGMSWSFAHRREGDMLWHHSSEVDWTIARCFFVRSARAGHWAAANNLAVMAMGGFGKPKPAASTVRLLLRSIRLSSSKQPAPLRHLAKCYREGLGIQKDDALAASLVRSAQHLEGS